MSDPVPFARGGACPPRSGNEGRSFGAAAMITRTAS